MIGAMRGLGRLTFCSIWASPVGVAGKGAVETLTVTAFPRESLLRQLTVALKVGLGFVPATPRAMAAGHLDRSPDP